MKSVDFRFACPNPQCGEPWAHPTEDLVDIHGTAVYHCADCGAEIVFYAMTLEQAMEEGISP